MALAVALAMILSFVESQVPALVAIPGVKIGFANLAVVFVLYKVGAKEAALISLIRVFLVSLLFGTGMSLMYSAAGAVLSFAGMLILKKTNAFSCTAVSVAGGVLHNIGQIAMACLVLQTDVLRYYLPFLVLSGTVAGIVIGVISAIIIKRVDIDR